MSAAAAIAVVELAATILRLVEHGLLPPECVGPLCVRHPDLEPELERLRVARYLDARTASQVARGLEPVAALHEARDRSDADELPRVPMVTLRTLRAAAHGPSERAALEAILARVG